MSAIRQNQRLALQQKISPQQIQFIKLLQVPTGSLEQRIKEEIEGNPALEAPEGDDYGISESQPQDKEISDADYKLIAESSKGDRELNIDEYLASDNYDYKTRISQRGDDDDDYEAPIVQAETLYDVLAEQLTMIPLTENERIIGEQVIGSIDEDGYMRRPLKTIVNDLAFRQNLSVTLQEAEGVLSKIQEFDPPGIGARDLPECLILQLKRKTQTKNVKAAIEILSKHFEEFSKKHFSKIRAKMGLSEEEIKEVYALIIKLNPKPGESQSGGKQEYIVPDFILTVENEEIIIRLNRYNAPDLRVNRSYLKMYEQYRELEKKKKDGTAKETLEFVKQRIESAQWFIDALHQRQFTLLDTMQTIAEKQKEYFLSEGDPRKLRPMILKDIAEVIGMDISTVSRVANSKYVETDFGIFPLKHFFTEGIETDAGIVSNREVKTALKELIDNEDKTEPLSDDVLTEMLNEKGYSIARRTVAKYREGLNIPVARMRKEM